MSRALIVIQGDTDRQTVSNWALKAKQFTRVEFKAPKRTLPQNDRMWAMCTDIAKQKTHYGMKLTPDDWKLLFLDALNTEVRAVPSLNGRGFVNLGRSSDLGVEEMTDLIEIIFEWGARNGVVFNDPKARAA